MAAGAEGRECSRLEISGKKEIVCRITRALPLPDTPRRAKSSSAALPTVFATQPKGAVIRRKEQNDGFCSVKRV